MWRKGYRSSLNLAKALDTADWKRKYLAENPSYFKPEGITIFCGRQGSGKTYSLVEYLYRVMRAFPECLCYSDISLFGLFDEFKDRIFPYTGMSCLSDVQNGFKGVVYVIDELPLLFSSLESKGASPVLLQEIAQQRKQRKHILGTAQVFERSMKPFREQCNEVVFCQNYFGVIQRNVIMDGYTLSQLDKDSNKHYGDQLRTYWLVHDQRFYESFDTYEKVIREGGVRL